MQMMAVWAGGSLVQHVPDVVGDTSHSPAPDAYGDVRVTTAAGSQSRACRTICGTDQ